MRRGCFRFAAVMDWARWNVLCSRLSNSMDVGSCIQALEEVLVRYGSPEVFSTDQGSQFAKFELRAS